MTGKYRAYPEYKDSGVEWLGDMPAPWPLSPLKYLCSFSGGGTPSKDRPEYWNGDIPWVSPKDMKSARVTSTIDNITELAVKQSSTSLVRSGALLMVVRSGILQHSIPVAINDVPVTLNQDMKALRLNSRLNVKYLMYFISGNQTQLLLEWGKQGATVESIEQEYLANTIFPTAPIHEQNKIAAFLDHETAKIDTLIERQQQLIQLLKEKRQAVISHAVTKGLSSLNGGPNAKLRDSGVEWLGEVPEHWIVAGFKKYLSSIVDYRGKTPEKHDSGVFLVTARNIKNGAINYDASQEYISEDDYESVMCRGKPKFGDLLFTTEAPLGEVASVDREDIALAQRVIKFDGQPGILNNFYLKYLIMSMQFQQSLMMFSSGSTAPGIKAERFVYLRSLIPPLSEQLEIIDYIESITKKIDNLIVKAIDGIEIMQERRTALISAAVTGKIDVRDWVAPQASPTHKEVAA